MNKFKKILNILLLISFISTLLVPLTGVHMHKLAAALFLLLTIVHTLMHRKSLGAKNYILLGVVFVAFISGVLGMILDQYAIVLALHKVIAIAAVFFLAIHIFVYHKELSLKAKGKQYAQK